MDVHGPTSRPRAMRRDGGNGRRMKPGGADRDRHAWCVLFLSFGGRASFFLVREDMEEGWSRLVFNLAGYPLHAWKSRSWESNESQRDRAILARACSRWAREKTGQNRTGRPFTKFHRFTETGIITWSSCSTPSNHLSKSDLYLYLTQRLRKWN